MTDLIPLDAAIASAKSLFGTHTTGLYGAAVRRQYGLITETAEATIRAIPTIDPAAIREDALREAADEIKLWWASGDDVREPDELILAMIGEKK